VVAKDYFTLNIIISLNPTWQKRGSDIICRLIFADYLLEFSWICPL
jgi:hypothetical protein